MKNKQTAVEWLESELDWLSNYMMDEHKEQIFNQAKAMEKEQNQLDYIAGHDLCRCVTDNTDEAKECFEDYYKETYGKYNSNARIIGVDKEDITNGLGHTKND